MVGLATYTWFKRRWWGGPFYNAWIVAVLMLIGHVSAAGVAGQALRWPPALPFALLATFFGYANFVLAGYFKDVSADRVTGYHTLPVVAGRSTAALVSDLYAGAAIVTVLLAMASGGVLERALAPFGHGEHPAGSVSGWLVPMLYPAVLLHAIEEVVGRGLL